LKQKILVTSALPYANGNIHLGHLSGAYLPADIFVRYHRLNNSDIIFVCGSDEHGVPITITADKEGKTPNEVIDKFHQTNKNAFERFGMSFDIYSRTSLPVHHETAQTFFLNFYKQGILPQKSSMQFFDEKINKFLPDRYIEGTCPKCGYEEARSDECEKCGSLYDPSELKNPKSKISGETPKLKETFHWYFPLGKFQTRLEEYISKNSKEFKWKENVLQYCRSWFNDGLQDRAITRDLDWGVQVPLEEAKGKVLYVWFEAVLGYISATKELFAKKGKPEEWKKYWQNENTRYIAFIGKDNTVFHTIIFPAMLMAWNDNNNDKYILPENVPANEFLNFEGKKFSKSRGWGIDVDEFLNLFPPDPLRYTLAANLPENKDTDFYWREFQLRNNSELADILGNFINRTFTFAHKHFNGVVPSKSDLQKIDLDMLSLLEEYPKKIGTLIDSYKIKDAVFEMMNLARAANKYFNDSQPWLTVKSSKELCANTINISLQTIFTLGEIFSPVIPFSSEKIFKMLNSEPVAWKDCGKINLPDNHQLGKFEILFNKIEDELIEKQTSRLGVVDEVQQYDVPKISYDEFAKIDLRVAQIISAERVKKSEKLIKLIVNTLGGERQIVAGIGKYYTPEELINKKVIIVANLLPAKLMGVESNGMLLAGENKDGLLKIIEADGNLSVGDKIK
jgi:methionyl-tRNA synthetase